MQCRDWLEIPKERVFVNDPIFFCGEIELLKLLDLEVVSENIECNLKCQVHYIKILHADHQGIILSI